MSLTMRFEVGESGTTLFAWCTGSPLPQITGLGAGSLTYKVNGGSPVTPPAEFWTDPGDNYTSPFVWYPVPSGTINPGDTVTVSVPAGHYVSNALTSPAYTDAACTNSIGVSILPDPNASPHTLRLGYQVTPGETFAHGLRPANWMKFASADWSDGFGDTTGVNIGGWNSDGYPTGSATTACTKNIALAELPPSVSNQYEFIDAGRYTLLWDGNGDAVLLAAPRDGITVTEVVGLRNITGTTNNRRVYDVAWSSTNVGIFAQVNTTGGKSVSNMRVFDPHITDPLNPPYFHPKHLAQIAGVKVFRAKDLRKIDGGNAVGDYADFATETSASYDMGMTARQIPIASLSTVNTGPYCRDGQYQIKVTFSTTHPFRSGQWMLLFFPVGTPGSVTHTNTYTIHFQDSTTENRLMASLCYVLDSTSVILLGGWTQKPMTTTDLSGSGAFAMVYRGTVPPSLPYQLVLDLDALTGGAVEMHESIPHSATDDCVTSLATLAASMYPAGRTLIVEYTNEPWNGSAGYPQSSHVVLMGREVGAARAALGDTSWNDDIGTIGQKYYVLRSGQMRELWLAAWTGAGRDASEIKWLLNAPAASWGTAANYLTFAGSHDTSARRSSDPGYAGPMSFDLIGTALYYTPQMRNHAIDPSVWDTYLTVDRVCDIVDAFTLAFPDSGVANWDVQFRIVLESYPGVEMDSYEGGPQSLNLGGTHNDTLTISYWNHPRAARAWLNQVKYYEGVGYPNYIRLGSASLFVIENNVGTNYATYVGLTQEAGVGDGSDAKFDNRLQLIDGSGFAKAPDPQQLVSVIGKAVNDWNGNTPALPSFSVSPTTVYTSSTATLTLIGTNTDWGGGTTFNVSGVSGTSKTGQTVSDAEHATVDITTGTSTGTLTVSDGTATAHVTITAAPVSGTRVLLAIRV